MTIISRRTFMGSLLAAVPSVGIAAKLARIDPIINAATVILTTANHGTREFKSHLHQSGRQAVFYQGLELETSDGRSYEWRKSDYECVDVRCYWNGPDEFYVELFNVAELRNS